MRYFARRRVRKRDITRTLFHLHARLSLSLAFSLFPSLFRCLSLSDPLTPVLRPCFFLLSDPFSALLRHLRANAASIRLHLAACRRANSTDHWLLSRTSPTRQPIFPSSPRDGTLQRAGGARPRTKLFPVGGSTEIDKPCENQLV